MGVIRPGFIDDMGWHMAEVYGAVTDQILINLAHYFPYWKPGQRVPASSFEYQATMLAQMGQVNKDTIRIIANGLGGANSALVQVLEQACMEAVRKSQPELLRGVMTGILNPARPPVTAPNQMRAFQLYYQQAAQKLNMVNTVMLESTKQAYQNTVSDIVSRINATQTALDIGAAETVTGVSSWNQAVRHSIERMKQGGVVGFIDHAGHRWSAEAYTAMDIRTTVANTARAAVWETNQDFGNDLYLVSYHNGARPLCYPWQNMVVSSLNNPRIVTDLDGNEIQVIAQDTTSYGEPAGLFGINCKHYPSPFIPGVSLIRGEPQDKQDNEKTYAESQEQRRLERKLREEKRDLLMAKAQGADKEELDALRERIRQSSQDIDDFCESTGRARHRDREGAYTKRDFPDPDTYDPQTFAQDQKKVINQYFHNGGAQQRYMFGEMEPHTPSVPVAPAPAPTPAPSPVAPITTQTVAPQAQPAKSEVVIRCENMGIKRVPVSTYATQPTEEEIISKLAGGDRTKGSCSSVALAYAGNKCGFDVTDFRGGLSQQVFARFSNIHTIATMDGVNGSIVSGYNDFTNAHKLLAMVQEGKEYYFTCGKHAAIVRKVGEGFEYLEMQSSYRKNTWYALSDSELKRRFGAQKSHTMYGEKFECSEALIDIESLRGNKAFEEILQFINTATGEQMKGVGGGER